MRDRERWFHVAPWRPCGASGGLRNQVFMPTMQTVQGLVNYNTQQKHPRAWKMPSNSLVSAGAGPRHQHQHHHFIIPGEQNALGQPYGVAIPEPESPHSAHIRPGCEMGLWLRLPTSEEMCASPPLLPGVMSLGFKPH